MYAVALLLLAAAFLLSQKREFLEVKETSAPPATGVPSEPPVQASSVTSIDNLEAEYDRLRTEYEQLMARALGATRKEEVDPLVRQLLELNTQLQTTLDTLIQQLATQEAAGKSEFTARRDEFTARLARIRQDYSGLLSGADKLTTLRRIREHQQEQADKGLQGYLIAFAVAVALLFVVIVFKMVQSKNDLNPTYPIASNPMTSPPLST